jgi:SAM-dependent methyltransferase
MIEHTNLEDYEDPVIYDLENKDFEDGPFYLSLAQQVSGSALELGCGTGRVTIPLAQKGIDITGLDIVPEMLARAQEKAGDLPIQWIEADIRDFHLGKRFELIYTTGSVFQHLVERRDQEMMLACVREHLLTDGLFVVDLFFPSRGSMEDSEEQDWYTYEDEEGRTVRVTGTDKYDPIGQIKHETAYRRWQDEEGREIVQRARLALRLIFPQEMEALLHYNGFSIIHRYGGWDRSSLTAESQLMIYVCKRNET